AVRRDRDSGVGLGDAVADGAAGVVVVAGHIGERPRIAISTGVGVRRGAQVQTAQAFARHAGRRAGGGVAGAVVSQTVRRDRDRGGGLANAVADGAGGVVVVAGHISERPRIAISAGVGVR